MEILPEPSLTLLDVFMLYQTSTFPATVRKINETESFFWNKVLELETPFNEYLFIKILTAIHNQWSSYTSNYQQHSFESNDTNVFTRNRGVSDADKKNKILIDTSISPVFASDDHKLSNSSSSKAHLITTSKDNLVKPKCQTHGDTYLLSASSSSCPNKTNDHSELLRTEQIGTPPKFLEPLPKLSRPTLKRTIPGAFSSTRNISFTPHDKHKRPAIPDKKLTKSRSMECMLSAFDSELVTRGEIALRERRRVGINTLTTKSLAPTQFTNETTKLSTNTNESKKDSKKQQEDDNEWQLFSSLLQRTTLKNVIKIPSTKEIERMMNTDNLVEKYLRGKFNAIQYEGGTTDILINGNKIAISAGVLVDVLNGNYINNFIYNQKEYYEGLHTLAILYIGTIRPFCSIRNSSRIIVSALKTFNKLIPPIMALERRISRMFTFEKGNENIINALEWYSKELICYGMYIEKIKKIRELIQLTYKEDVLHSLEIAINEYEETHEKVKPFEELIELPIQHFGRLGAFLFYLMSKTSEPSQIIKQTIKKYIQVLSSISDLSLKKLNQITGMDLKKKGRYLIHFGGVKITSKEFKGKEWKLCLLFNDILLIAKIDVTEKYRNEREILTRFENAPSGNDISLLKKYYCKVEYTCDTSKLIVCSDKNYSFTLNTMICICYNMKERDNWISSFHSVKVSFLN
ncbi:hypothetical protein EHI8A_010810 [Entamoeba histolytica HM-1:IMSS-B]|uniref:PH domain-containing protein n=4 Tax=Entamoeba histolytica TaxID=5759 RepID=C4M8E4_ENTH1|nr:hypothetical protein EHI_115330 [Entamoeba histolytica HM-1:IMSS]EAL44600.1 hypothetical protein EHI_115330 [Entamoeba histolytica HM-1:IMSS]EMH72139.1 hypothetical protein EHI8A_010810 [Entamoeba histolytica HM-1:IMSS-B]ENY65432.1 hypothetical protein EHI7A_016940 [Entamoeba histolytica HM-1:IMSS-A]GAT97867.1 hypothetical protein CL6EHI_115330 [Entamoeba histolytica]|eukprot:XP_649986.1 hypothetical protein EHI_115330 [Entamoeba histolytica HM-1:IMSS]